MFFINGLFWQQGRVPYIGHDHRIGSVVMIGERQIEAAFNGLIGERSLTTGHDGFLLDIFGQSVITNFLQEEGKISFFKQYEHRLGDNDFLISYVFTTYESGVWTGKWEAPAVGLGEARCILTPIPDDFFLRPR